MDTITAKQAAGYFKGFNKNEKLCEYCYATVQENDEGEEYCPNEMCLYDGDL